MSCLGVEADLVTSGGSADSHMYLPGDSGGVPRTTLVAKDVRECLPVIGHLSTLIQARVFLPLIVPQVTQSEVNAGRVTKEASVSGTAVNGVEVNRTVETVVDLPPAPAIAIGEFHSTR